LTAKPQSRLQKDKMLPRIEDGDGKQREHVVLSMTPRSDSSTADASIPHPNHLR